MRAIILILLVLTCSGCVTQVAYEAVKGAHPVEINVNANQETTLKAIEKVVADFGYIYEPGRLSASYGYAKSPKKDWHIYFECGEFPGAQKSQVKLWRVRQNKSPLAMEGFGDYEPMNPDFEFEIRKILYAIKRESEIESA